MTTWQPETPTKKSDFERWPSMDHFDFQKKQTAEVKAFRLRKRWWADHGEYTIRCIIRGLRSLNAVS